MPDQVATFGLDDSEFRSGLARMGAAGSEASERMEGHWREAGEGAARHLGKIVGAYAVAHEAFRKADEAVREYSKDHETMAQQYRQAEEAAKRLEAVVGRDLVAAYGMVKAAAVGFLSVAWEQASKVADGIAATIRPYTTGSFGGETIGDLNNNRAAAEEQDKEIKRQAAMKKAYEDLRIEQLKAQGYVTEAEMMDEERVHQQKIKDLKEQSKEAGGFNADQSAKLQALERSRHEGRLKQIYDEGQERKVREINDIYEKEHGAEDHNREAAEQAAREQVTRQKAHDDAIFGMRVEDQRARIAALRAAGMEKESEQLRVQLELQEQLHAIEGDQNLSPEEKRSAAGHARDRARLGELAARAAAKDDENGGALRAGLYGGGLSTATLSQALGGTPVVEHARKTAENSEAIKTLLSDLKQTVETWNRFGAILG